ncbi:MAG: septum formation protein Maf [Alphaproteobacteria bacterium]|nr:septum formation protein Maf [Alphaproteobacteria bacterium]
MADAPAAGIVLASSSRTRRAMLEAAGVRLEVVAPRVDERALKESLRGEGADGAGVAEYLAEAKARYGSRHRAGRLCIGADQVLDCDGVLFDKPVDMDGARMQLASLRGRRHALVSCAVAMLNGERLWHHVDRAELAMRDFSDGFLDSYLETIGAEALDGPGGYRLEGLGAQLFARVSGDYFTILGLPLLPLLDYLRARKVLPS